MKVSQSNSGSWLLAALCAPTFSPVRATAVASQHSLIREKTGCLMKTLPSGAGKSVSTGNPGNGWVLDPTKPLTPRSNGFIQVKD